MPAQPRQSHLKNLLSLDTPYIVLIDHATSLGWTAISQARSYLLGKSTSEVPLHVVAPCPHDGVCPLADSFDICGFSQRLQSTAFLRKTKQNKKGEEDKRYCYVVIAKGARPSVMTRDGIDIDTGDAAAVKMQRLGRIGGVAKDQMQRGKGKMDGKSMLRQVEGEDEGGVQYEMISMERVKAEQEDSAANAAKEKGVGLTHTNVTQEEVSSVNEEQMVQSLREEAYNWPRLVAPPMKRSGHVVMDVCAENGVYHLSCPRNHKHHKHHKHLKHLKLTLLLGNIQRITVPKSLSKQSYYDARKTYWGDLYPHTPKGRVIVRDRGVRRLKKVENNGDVDTFFEEMFGSKSTVSPEQEEPVPPIPGMRMSTKVKKTRSEKAQAREQKDLKPREGRWKKVVHPEEFDKDLVPKRSMPSPDSTNFQEMKAQIRMKMPELAHLSIFNSGVDGDVSTRNKEESVGRPGNGDKFVTIETWRDGKLVSNQSISKSSGRRLFGTLARPNVGLSLASESSL